MNFADVLRELELEPIHSESATWEQWADENGLKLPNPFLEALRLGAAELLSKHSNAEDFEEPQPLRFFWEGHPVLPLLWENQGNYLFGLHLNGSDNPPVLLCSEWEWQGSEMVNLHWQPYAENFAAFAFARLFDYQYRWTAGEDGWEETPLPLSLPPLDAELAARLSTFLKRGPTTPEVICLDPGGSRQRFYRPGQRLSFTRAAVFTDNPDQPHWEWFSASPADHAALIDILQEVMS